MLFFFYRQVVLTGFVSEGALISCYLTVVFEVVEMVMVMDNYGMRLGL